MMVNDVGADGYTLTDVGTLIFDEAHRTVGKYAYVGLAERYRSERPRTGRVLALTASPGGEEGRIEGVVAARGVARVEARQRTDEGVREFVQPVTIEHRWVRLSPALRPVQELLREALF